MVNPREFCVYSDVEEIHLGPRQRQTLKTCLLGGIIRMGRGAKGKVEVWCAGGCGIGTAFRREVENN